MATQTKALVQAERTSLMMQGIVSILFGVAAVLWPGLTLEVLIYLIGVFLVVDGIVALILGFMNLSKKTSKGLLFLVIGMLEIVIGVGFFQWTGLAFETVILVLALTLLARGIFSLTHSFTAAKKESSTMRTMHGMVGIIGILVGGVLLAYPIETTVVLVWIVGLYALVTGPLLLAMSADVSKLSK